MAENRVIGRDGQLPWHLPADLAHVKRLTMGKPLIMGRGVLASLNHKPLPGRHNIVLSRDPAFHAPGFTVVHSADEALAAAGDADEVIIFGGAQVYELFLPRTDRIYLTVVHADLAGDTWFLELNPDEWRETARTEHPADERNTHGMSFLTLDRRATVAQQQQ